jgi:hypothetical protein
MSSSISDAHSSLLQIRDRLNEKRSMVGAVAFEVVRDHLLPDPKSGRKSVCGKLSTMAYAEWALRANGPALFGRPTPINFTDPSEPGYTVR